MTRYSRHGTRGLLRFVGAAILACAALPLAAADPYSTISDQARAFAENNTPGALDPQSIAEWEAVSGAIGEPGVLTDAGAAAVASYGATVSTREIAGTRHLLVEPAGFDPSGSDRIILYVHGGAYTLARPELVIASFLKIAEMTGAPVLGVRYPLAWQAPRPAQSDRVLDVYRKILETHSARYIVMVGDSAAGASS